MIALHKMLKCINMWLQGLPTNLLNVTWKWDLVAIQAVTCLVSFHWSPVIHSTWGTFIPQAMCLLWSMGPVGKYKCLLSFPCVHTNLLVRSGVVNILQRYWSTKNRGKVILSFFLSFWNENYSLTNLRENWNAVKQKWFKNRRSKSQCLKRQKYLHVASEVDVVLKRSSFSTADLQRDCSKQTPLLC